MGTVYLVSHSYDHLWRVIMHAVLTRVPSTADFDQAVAEAPAWIEKLTIHQALDLLGELRHPLAHRRQTGDVRDAVSCLDRWRAAVAI